MEVRKNSIYFSLDDFWEVMFYFCATANSYEKREAVVGIFEIILDCNIFEGLNRIARKSLNIINYSTERDLMNYFCIVRFYHEGLDFNLNEIYDEFMNEVTEF